ncbi:MAG: N-acetylglutaminylglutamine synthetase [Magnetococcales bacterium]|nr:N-acetylglutaminylglutamine synthetase [Magnetococcales bacterium]
MDWKQMASLRSWGAQSDQAHDALRAEAMVDCGWGKLLFGHTFPEIETLAAALLEEDEGERNLAFYSREPHVILSKYPQEIFLDPSHAFRLNLNEPESSPWHCPGTLRIRPAQSREDLRMVNLLYQARKMVPMREAFTPPPLDGPLTILLAENVQNGAAVAAVMAVDHRVAFDDPDNGSSLWALSVDPSCALPGVGEALVRHVAELFRQRKRDFLDLSVLHDNREAIALYEKLGFTQVPVFCLKRKNSINEPLFMSVTPEESLNPYSRIIANEARRRGIAVEVLDQERQIVRYSFGGRSILCRESLSELTSAVSMTLCDDKALTHRLLIQAGLQVPRQQAAGSAADNEAFLQQCGIVVVKPARGEQGQGVSVDVRTPAALAAAVQRARLIDERVLLEEFCHGQDLRVIVIGGEVVAAALRQPASITGDGVRSIEALINKQSQRRAAATGGESRIPLDAETIRFLTEQGFALTDILPAGHPLVVRRTANLHTGGTIHDVTEQLHPCLADVAVRAAAVLSMPVVGLDFLVMQVTSPDYVIVEANERPGLANHEPQPTAERFMDLLFPQTKNPSVNRF